MVYRKELLFHRDQLVTLIVVSSVVEGEEVDIACPRM
jgi:hypothetical protein